MDGLNIKLHDLNVILNFEKSNLYCWNTWEWLIIKEDESVINRN